MRYWGKHLLVNAANCNRQMISCPRNIELFTTNLVKSIDMVAYGKPSIQYFGHGNKAGYTLVQLIETSNITGHFTDEDGGLYMDVFSCKNFEEATVRDAILYWFKPTVIDTKVMYRTAGVKME